MKQTTSHKSGNATIKAANSLPKNFTPPLTCFFWANGGGCRKTPEDCIYAHWNTGLIATAPVSMANTSGAVAGRNAIAQVNNQIEREQYLQAWAARLLVKEKELDAKEDTVETLLKRLVVINQRVDSFSTAAANILFKRGGCKIALANGTGHVVDEAVVVPEHAAEDTIIESVKTPAGTEWTLEKLKPMMNELIDIASAFSEASRA